MTALTRALRRCWGRDTGFGSVSVPVPRPYRGIRAAYRLVGVVRVGGLVAVLAGLLFAAPAYSQAPRLAAPSDCLTNPNCGPGLQRTYGVDVSPFFVPLTV